MIDNEGQHGSRWKAVISIAAKIGCAPQTLNDWVKKAEVARSACYNFQKDWLEILELGDPTEDE